VNIKINGNDLTADLQLELKMTEAFLEVLKKEQEALVGGDIEHLETLPRDKAELVMQLAKLARKRDQHLISRGLTPDRKGMEALLADNHDAKTATAKWHELLRLAESVQQLNQTNGEIIATRLRHNHQALTVLQGAAGTTPLYGPTGKTFTLKGSRQLGQV
jgi:flagella synthesis protein FlgN